MIEEHPMLLVRTVDLETQLEDCKSRMAMQEELIRNLTIYRDDFLKLRPEYNALQARYDELQSQLGEQREKNHELSKQLLATSARSPSDELA